MMLCYSEADAEESLEGKSFDTCIDLHSSHSCKSYT